MNSVRQRPAASAARTLLQECQLPTSDLTEAHFEHFFGYGADGALQGVVGLELYRPVALLRSLAVTPGSRARGVGRALVAEAERYARSQGVAEIYLLTTTAERFFARAGYERIARESAPAAIQHTQEFSSLCQTTSAFMRKRL